MLRLSRNLAQRDKPVTQTTMEAPVTVAVGVDAKTQLDKEPETLVTTAGGNTQNTVIQAALICTVMAVNAAAGVVCGMHPKIPHHMIQLQPIKTKRVDPNISRIAG